MNYLRTTVRRFSAMATTTSCSPFTRAVVSSMRKLYPEALADKSFDNTGLLLEAPLDPSRRQKNSVLLAIDLTTAVADEAIKRRDSAIVAYHPIIFRGLKSITLEDTQQRSLLRLAQHGISVYSPHTAVDTVPGGMADWLCDVVTGVYGENKPSQIASCASSNYSAPTYPRPEFAASATQTSIPHARTTIHPSPSTSIPEGFEDAGAGRLVTFNSAQPLTKLIDFIGQGVGLPGGIPIAIPQSKAVDDIHIRTVGMCPGSGSGVLMRGELPDLLFTGEMSHHEALAATERGSVVISLAHSNSERGYLHAVMRNKLLQDLSQRWHAERETALQGALEEDSEVYRDAEVSVSVSEADRDPYGIMVRR
ncbi:hypothetical protein N7448_004686 [Penicillium atrosanguineum]|uniref:NGG1 interacting factor Nif3 n=1 Tax=Penicillium atrosanguineum TaxID=1132637 RepID=A0A9W9U1Q2_9EURO|nr:uncharacterized protein N7443_008436 [Penicillium atrosanguineum]KAJ5136132.1 hypothetical protein N7448_004686 [Penicillium atrosanguineum]KAJ5292483.1 hypothetical protein N7443_008436 [Penicillium atrosanguineum]KAJ5303494.1 hypothetical protein N7476_010293 [Penicillium atrosanguineum]